MNSAFFAVHSFYFKGKTFQLNFGQCNLLSAMWRVTSGMWHVQTSNMWNIMYNSLETLLWQICFFLITLFWIYIQNPHHHLLVGQNKHLAGAKYVWRQTPHHVASTSIRGWNLYPNREDLIQKPGRICLIWKIVSLTPLN